MKTIEAYAPVFPGFYGTIFEPYEEQEIELYNEDNGTNYQEFKFDYDDYYNQVGEQSTATLLWEIQNELGLSDEDFNMEFIGIHSPREYNFTNDSLNINYHVTENALKRIVEELKEYREEFEEYIKDKFTSRSGFVSFYSNDINVWFEKYLQMDGELQIAIPEALNFLLIHIYEYNEESLLDNVIGNVSLALKPIK